MIAEAPLRVWHGLLERRIPFNAAGLAFYFLFGLVPFLFIMASISGYFLRTNPGIYEQVGVNLLEILPPGMGAKLLHDIEAAAANWQTFGALAFVSLVLVAMGLFDALDEGINAVMGTKKKVGFLAGRLIAFLYVVGAIIFFSLSAAAGYSVGLLRAIPYFQEHPYLVDLTGRYFSTWVFAVFMVALYMIFPQRTPKWWRALIVAAAVALAWSVLQKLGSIITAGLSRRQAIYGALGGAAVFLTWMYLLALLILLGARILDLWDVWSTSRAAARDGAAAGET